MRTERAMRVVIATLVGVLGAAPWMTCEPESPRRAWAAPSASAKVLAKPPTATATPGGDECQKGCLDDQACNTQKEQCELGCCIPLDRAEQESPVTRSGHELLTVLSAAAAQVKQQSVFGAAGAVALPVGSRCSSDDCAHGARSYAVFSAVMGVRWADLMGFRAGPMFKAQQRCLSAVAQDNEEVQYDHALRRRDDEGPAGGVSAIKGTRQRLLERFKKAALAADGEIEIADGGGAQDHFKVQRPFFLLGRALHIVQDSFSTFHTKRQAPSYQKLLQINSYVCTKDSPQHLHVTPGVLNLIDKDARDPSGDIVRKKDCDELTCLKPEYVASVTASQQLWLLLAQVRAADADKRADTADRVMQPYLDTWFKVPKTVPSGPNPAETCTIESQAAIDARRTACLKMTGSGEGLDAPFSWKKLSFSNIP